MKIDRYLVKDFHTELLEILDAMAEERGLKRVDSHITYSNVRLVFKLELQPNDLEKIPATVEELNLGLAKPGMICVVQGKTAVILKARRSKYLFYFEDKPETKYTISFSGCKSIKQKEV